MAKQKKKSQVPYLSSNITSIMSVTLVLVLVGIMAVLGTYFHNATNEVQENIGFDVVLTEDATLEQTNQLIKVFNEAPYKREVIFTSKEDALKAWEEETGEDLVSVLGVNPLSAEFEVKVIADYANPDSLQVIEQQLQAYDQVHAVKMHKELVAEVASNINRMMLLLAGIAVVLLIISLMLINNTVRLTIYSRRFLIHTMKLVGADRSFICMPFVRINALNGFIASIVAIILLASSGLYLSTIEPSFGQMVSALEVAVIFALLMACGVIVCALAAWISVNNYVTRSYDELFTK